MEMIYKGELKEEDLYSKEGKDTVSKIFKNELKKERKKK